LAAGTARWHSNKLPDQRIKLTDIPHTPSHDDRRREQRLPYLRDCQVKIRSPQWAVLPGYLLGVTNNITMHGVRLALDGFSRSMFAQWAAHLQDGETLLVTVGFEEGEELIELPGEITWSLFRESEEDPDEGICEAGVLLSLLDPATEESLRRLIERLSQ